MYHRIIDPKNVPYPVEDGMYVHPQSFQVQMEFLANQCNVIQLDSLIAGLIAGQTFPRRTVALSFDDGWVDNYLYAYPVLKSLSLPATIFLATKYISTTDLIWTDKVAVFLQAICRGQTVSESLANLSTNTVDVDSLIVEIFHNFIDPGDHKGLKEAIHHVLKSFKAYKPKQLKGVISVLEQSFRNSLTETGRSFMNWDEIREMAKNGISFGSHGHNHYDMTNISPEQFQVELTHSKEEFHKAQVPISSVFCFPGGYWNTESLRLLAENDYIGAISASRNNHLSYICPIIGRVGIHQDVSQTLAMFKHRIWSKLFF